MSVEELVAAVAVVPFTMAVVVIAVAVLRVPAAGPAELVAGIALGLELLLAAGLLRLAALQDLRELVAVAAIIALRRLIGIGLRSGLRALGVAGRAGVRA